LNSRDSCDKVLSEEIIFVGINAIIGRLGRGFKVPLADISNISVIGAGTMGHGIGLTYALRGYRVALNDLNETILGNAMSHIRDELRTLAENELISPDMIEATLSHITTTTNLKEAVRNADFVTEAVWEDVEVKKAVFRDLGMLCPEHTILASNTSALLLRDIASDCQRKDKVIITHWVNPPHLVPLVEVVPGEETSEVTVAIAYNLLKKLKKVPVKIKKEIPGFVLNRLQAALMREVWSLWQQGIASAEDIDLMMKASLGFRWAAIGPLETADLGGLDIFYKVMGRLFKVISDSHEPPEELRKMVEAGKLGLKSGQGFFDYDVSYFEEGEAASVRARDRKHIQLLKLWYS
jgi:3-hydroxybutyryl-CoA dehydrogenase